MRRMSWIFAFHVLRNSWKILVERYADLLKSMGYDLTNARMLSFIDFIMTEIFVLLEIAIAHMTMVADNNCMARTRNPVNPHLRKFILSAIRYMQNIM